MRSSPDQCVAEFYAQTYDDIACGTGRIAIRLAQDGTQVVGLDLSPAMLEVAREKSMSEPLLE